MTLTVRAFDLLSDADARQMLRSCCGAARWVDAMAARRPFGTLAALLAAADDVWRSSGEADWREAFSHHPRIGERTAAVVQDARAAAWSAGEQAVASATPTTVQDEMVQVNREYERRFGHIYIVCASGRSAEALLAIARARLVNEPAAELRVAAAEQHRITRLRLEKLFREDA
jgi:OHCU decarboxylase